MDLIVSERFGPMSDRRSNRCKMRPSSKSGFEGSLRAGRKSVLVYRAPFACKLFLALIYIECSLVSGSGQPPEIVYSPAFQNFSRSQPSQSFIDDPVKPITQISLIRRQLQVKQIRSEEEEDGFIMQTSSPSLSNETTTSAPNAPDGVDQVATTPARPSTDDVADKQEEQQQQQNIAINANRQQFVTHDQLSLLNASTKDENINISAPINEFGTSSRGRDDQISSKSQRAATPVSASKVSLVSSFFSDLLAYATRPRLPASEEEEQQQQQQQYQQQQQIQQVTSTIAPTSTSRAPLSAPSSSPSTCPGTCRSIITASLLCYNEIDAPCPSLFQKCCDENDAAFDGTSVETSAPIAPPDVDPSAPTPQLDNLPQAWPHPNAPAQPPASGSQPVAHNGTGVRATSNERPAPPVSPPNESDEQAPPRDRLGSGEAQNEADRALALAGSAAASSPTLYFLSSAGSEPAETSRPNERVDATELSGQEDQLAQPADDERSSARSKAPEPESRPASAPVQSAKHPASQSFDMPLSPQNRSQESAGADLPKCTGFCALPLFTVLCDSIYDSPECESSKKCCVMGEHLASEESSSPSTLTESAESAPTPTSTSRLTCRGSCLPVYHSSLCTRPNEVQLDSPGCLPNFVCCMQPLAIGDEGNLLDESQQDQIHSTESSGHSDSASASKDSSLLASLIPPPPPGAETINPADQMISASARQRPSLDTPPHLAVASTQNLNAPPNRPSGHSKQEQSPSSGGIMSQLYSIFKLSGTNSANSKQRPRPPPVPAAPPVAAMMSPQQQLNLMGQMYADSYASLSHSPPQAASELNTQHQIQPSTVQVGGGQYLLDHMSASSMQNTLGPQGLPTDAKHQPQYNSQPTAQVGSPSKVSFQVPATQPRRQNAVNLPPPNYNLMVPDPNSRAQAMNTQNGYYGQFHSIKPVQASQPTGNRVMQQTSAVPYQSGQAQHPRHHGQAQPTDSLMYQQLSQQQQQQQLHLQQHHHQQQQQQQQQHHNQQQQQQQQHHQQQQHYQQQQQQQQHHQYQHHRVQQQPHLLPPQQLAFNQGPSQHQMAVATPNKQSQLPNGDLDRSNNRFTQSNSPQQIRPPSDGHVKTGSGDPHDSNINQANLEQKQTNIARRPSNSWTPSAHSQGSEVHQTVTDPPSYRPVRVQQHVDQISSTESVQQYPAIEVTTKKVPVIHKSSTKAPQQPAKPKPIADVTGSLNPSPSNLNALISNGPFIDLQRVLDNWPGSGNADESHKMPSQMSSTLCPGICMAPTSARQCVSPGSLDESFSCAQAGSVCCVRFQQASKNGIQKGPSSTQTQTSQQSQLNHIRNPPFVNVDSNKLDAVGSAIDLEDQLDDRPSKPSVQHVTSPFAESSSSSIQEVLNEQPQSKTNRIQEVSCGIPGHAGRHTSGRAKGRIMGGFDAKPGHWCWQVALMNDKNEYLCGGALIGTKWVLTAAHCITQHLRSESQLYARLGHHNLNSTQASEHARNFKVKTSYVHHNHNGITLDNDIALLRLESQVDLDNSSICLVCLPERSSQVEPGKRCTVTGYGFESESGPAALRVRQTDLPIVTDGECQNKTSIALGKPFTLPASSFCAGGELGQDACHGDGGSPLSCLVDGYYELTGIVSWGYKCGNKDLPGLYSKVSTFVGWINQIVSVNN